MLHDSIISDHLQALNTSYLKLKIRRICIEFVRSHKLYKQCTFYVAHEKKAVLRNFPIHLKCRPNFLLYMALHHIIFLVPSG